MRDFLLLPDARLDAEAGRIRFGGWLLVRDGRVEGAGEGTAPQALIGEVEEIRGGFLTEPLSDAHVHLFLGGSFDAAERKSLAALDRETAIARALSLLEAYRKAGIFVVRDGGDPLGIALEAARLARVDPARYATVLPSGEPLYKKGSYGGFLGRGIETREDGRRLIEENARAGAAQIKLLATGLNSLENAGEVGPTQFSPTDIAYFFDVADSHGLPLMVHANGSLRDVLAFNRGTLEHGFWLHPDEFETMRERDIAWTPTCEAWAALSAHPSLDARAREVVSRTTARHAFDVCEGVRRGVPILAGSDAGTPGVSHVSGLGSEFLRLAAAGVPATDILASSVRFARRARGARGLRVGDVAEFVKFSKLPWPDPPLTGFRLEPPQAVFIGGVLS